MSLTPVFSQHQIMTTVIIKVKVTYATDPCLLNTQDNDHCCAVME